MSMNKIFLLAVCVLMSLGTHAAESQGKSEAAETLFLSTNLAAEVVAVRVSKGERVKRGTLLLKLEDEVAQARLQQARGELAHQELLFREAEKELQRSEELYERTLLADHDLDLARIAHAAAQSSYNNASLNMKKAQRDLELRRIVAPFDAQVTEIFVQAGETVNGQFNSVKLIALRPASSRQ